MERAVDGNLETTRRDELTRVLGVLMPVLDIVEGPIESPGAPPWCQTRGWLEFLLRLSDHELECCERWGLASGLGQQTNLPPGLAELARAVQQVTRLPRLSELEAAGPTVELPRGVWRGIRARKQEQIETLLATLPSLARRARRIVDVGAGSGHFSRLAAELFERETWALDRDAERLRRGSERNRERQRSIGKLSVHFVQLDVGQQPLTLDAGDLAVGLHACGELGDRLVSAAAAAGSDLVLMSCCLQKTSADVRLALSATASSVGFSLRRNLLGLTNLTSRTQGVEATLAANLAARETRLALRYLLRGRGLEVRPGEEMRGINRRRAQAGLDDVARLALARRGLPAPTSGELKAHAADARRDHATMRRLALPRNMLARLVELAIVLDRAALLEEHGAQVRVAELVGPQVTPRNTVLLASRNPERLPGGPPRAPSA